MTGQLLDVVIVIGSVNEGEGQLPYAQSKVYRIDLEERHLDQFIENIYNMNGVVGMETLVEKKD